MINYDMQNCTNDYKALSWRKNEVRWEWAQINITSKRLLKCKDILVLLDVSSRFPPKFSNGMMKFYCKPLNKLIKWTEFSTSWTELNLVQRSSGEACMRRETYFLVQLMIQSTANRIRNKVKPVSLIRRVTSEKF